MKNTLLIILVSINIFSCSQQATKLEDLINLEDITQVDIHNNYGDCTLDEKQLITFKNRLQTANLNHEGITSKPGAIWIQITLLSGESYEAFTSTGSQQLVISTDLFNNKIEGPEAIFEFPEYINFDNFNCR